MATQCIVIQRGKKPAEKTKKPIVFTHKLDGDLIIKETETKPKNFDHIELICKNYTGTIVNVDLMYAYHDSDRASTKGGGLLYLGQWNDGIVE
jgi:hypothetical protein